MKLNPVFRCLAAAVVFGLLALSVACSQQPPAVQETLAQKETASPAGSAQDAASVPEGEHGPKQGPAAQQTASGERNDEASSPQTEAAEPEEFIVPEGTPDELFAFLEGLQTKQPAAQDPESVMAFMGKLGVAVATASDRILGGNPSEEQAKQAVQYKLAGLGLLEKSGDKSALAKRAALPAELEAAGRGSLVRMVELDALVNRLQKLRSASREEAAAFAEDLAKFFEKSPPEPQEAALAMQVANNLERMLIPEEVAKVYERFGKIFAEHEDPQAARIGAMMAGSARRLNLMGNEMPLEGITTDGKEFNWDEYRGKVVLVDFWATWCGPCIEEMANIRENYDKFHKLGFDVVGISIDEDRGALDSFLAKEELPWTILVDEDLMKADRETMSTRYGVFGIPNVTLVGKDGKVIALDPRGPELGQRLAELLGDPPPAEPAEAAGDAPAKETEESKPKEG